MISNTLSKSRTNPKSMKITGSKRRKTSNSQTPDCFLQALWRLATLLTMAQLHVGHWRRTNPAYPVVLREYLRRHLQEDPESPSPLFWPKTSISVSTTTDIARFYRCIFGHVSRDFANPFFSVLTDIGLII